MNVKLEEIETVSIIIRFRSTMVGINNGVIVMLSNASGTNVVN